MRKARSVNRANLIRVREKIREHETRIQKRWDTTVDILKAVAALGFLGAVFVAPNLAQLLKYFDLSAPDEERRFIRKLEQMRRSGFLSFRGHELHLGKKAATVLAEEELLHTPIQVPKRWNHLWHMVIFDIPVEKGRARSALRARLTELGFALYQRSVFIHWVDAKEHLGRLAEFHHISEHVRFFDVTNLEDEEKVIQNVYPRPPRR